MSIKTSPPLESALDSTFSLKELHRSIPVLPAPLPHATDPSKSRAIVELYVPNQTSEGGIHIPDNVARGLMTIPDQYLVCDPGDTSLSVGDVVHAPAHAVTDHFQMGKKGEDQRAFGYLKEEFALSVLPLPLSSFHTQTLLEPLTV